MSMKNKVALKVQWTKNSWSGKEQWPPVWPTQPQLEEYKEWCKRNVGPNGWNYFGFYRKIPCEFRFKKSEDLLAFKLAFGLHYDTVHV